jgi:hypothetical protein
MNTLSFKFGPSPESNDHEVRILVDGVDILERVDKSSLGLDPVDFFAQAALLETGNLLIGRCGCGCLGCGDEAVSAVHDAGTVSWKSPHRWISGFVFERTGYLAAISRGRADTSWETVDRTAERLVSSLDFSVFERKGMKFEWASGRMDKTRMALSFNRGGQQELLYVDWNHRNPAEAELAVRRLIQDEVGA